MSSPDKPVDAPETHSTSGAADPAADEAAAAAPGVAADPAARSCLVSLKFVAAPTPAGPRTVLLPEVGQLASLDDLEAEAQEQYEDETSPVASELSKDEDPVPMEEEADNGTGEQEAISTDPKDQEETMEEDLSNPEADQLSIRSGIQDERSSSMEQDQPKAAGLQPIAIKAGSSEKDEPTSMESDDSISSPGGLLSSTDPNRSEDKNIPERDRPHIKMESDSDSNNARAGGQRTMSFEDRSSGPDTPGSDSLEGAAQARFKGLYRTQQLDTHSDTNSPAKSDSPASDPPGDDPPALPAGKTGTDEDLAVAGPSSKLSEVEKTLQLTECVDALSVTSDGGGPSKKLKTSDPRDKRRGLDSRTDSSTAAGTDERHFTPIEAPPPPASPPCEEEEEEEPDLYQQAFIKFCRKWQIDEKSRKEKAFLDGITDPVQREKARMEFVCLAALGGQTDVGELVGISRPEPGPQGGPERPVEAEEGEAPEAVSTADSSTSTPRAPESSNSATSPIPIPTTSEVATSPMVIPSSPVRTFGELPKDSARDSPMQTSAAAGVEAESPRKPGGSQPLKTPPKRKRSLSDSKDDNDDKSPQKLRKMDISPDPPAQDDSVTMDDSSDQTKSEHSKSPSKER